MSKIWEILQFLYLYCPNKVSGVKKKKKKKVNMSTGIKVQYIKRATIEIGKVDHIALKQKALRLTIWPVVDTANNSGL